jgi:hypothetical protein
MIPRFAIFKTSTCDPTDPLEPEVTGRCLLVSWFGVVIELSIGRRS